jgi:hypothetical protein
MLSKRNQAVLVAYLRGYRAVNGRVYNPDGKQRKLFIQSKKNSPYLCFTVRVEGISQLVPVHKLVAFQKFGGHVFQKNVVVRHLNSNRRNNKFFNIKIGSSKENAADKKRKDRFPKKVFLET